MAIIGEINLNRSCTVYGSGEVELKVSLQKNNWIFPSMTLKSLLPLKLTLIVLISTLLLVTLKEPKIHT